MDITTLCGTYGVGSTPDNLRLLFNADPGISDKMTEHEIPELNCEGMFALGGGANEWGALGEFDCASTTVYDDEHPDGTVDIRGWTMLLADCGSLPDAYPELQSASSLTVSEVTSGPLINVLSVKMPTEKDPKLVQVPKTELSPGLYQFTVIKHNGRVIQHYEDFSEPVILNSHFDSYADINIYPVPVKGKEFAVEFDLTYPLQVTMTVVDNFGNLFFMKELAFETAGLNKFVVEIEQKWEPGLYHTVFQYQDGSSESRNFSVSE